MYIQFPKALEHTPPRFWLGVVGFLFIALLVVGFLFKDALLKFTGVGSATYFVELTDEGFIPEELIIGVNDTVVFTTAGTKAFWPASNMHPEHTIYSQFDPGKPIAAGEQWKFTFNKAGVWKYHDHIQANQTGTIIVAYPDGTLPEKSAFTLDLEECAAFSAVYEKRQCWDAQLERAMSIGGVKLAFEYFKKLYETEPDVPKECHGWGHTLGEAGYEYYKKHGSITLEPETAYCGYGFYHAYLAELMKDTGELSKARDFCEETVLKMGDDMRALINNCKHGVGHGISSMLSENPEYYGDFERTSDTAIAMCDKVYETKNDLINCYDGVFNEIYQNVLNSRYGYSFEEYNSKNDPFWQCQELEDVYKESCYVNVVGIFPAIFQTDFVSAMKYVLANVYDLHASGAKIVAKVAADRIQATIVQENHADSLEMCALVPDFLSDTCFNGILNGFIQHGDPTNLHVKGYAFCDEALQNTLEYSGCYEAFTQHLKSTYSLTQMEAACAYIAPSQTVRACDPYL